MGQPKRKDIPQSESTEAVAPTPDAERIGGELEPEAILTPNTSPRLTPRGWGILAGVVLVLNLPLIHYYLLRARPEATVSVPFSDDFSNRDTVAQNYWSSGGHWRVVNG